MKPVAYEGADPYVFVSYAHRDADQVFAVLEELQARGYRLWYDDGIAPGSEWPEDIARHLDAAHLVIAFITPKSMASRNCRREINFSLSKEKPFLSVVLEETEMSLGMEMQLSAQQSIIRYNYSSWEAFINKILACPDLAPCRAAAGAPAEPPAAATGLSVTEAQPPATPYEAAPPELVEEYHDVEVVPPAQEPPTTPQLATSASAERSQAAKALPADAGAADDRRTKGVRKPPLPLIAAAVALMAVAFLVMRMLTGSFTTSWGQKVKKGATSLTIKEQTLTQDDLRSIAAMKKLVYLTLDGCDLSACDERALTFAAADLVDLNLAGSTFASDYNSPLFAGLSPKSLDLSGVKSIETLADMDTSNLRTLDVSGTAVTDLSQVVTGALTSLNFAHTAVGDLSPLADLSGLRSVNGSYTKVTSLKALTALEALEELRFDGCGLGALKQPFASLRLKEVGLAGAGVTSLKALSNCTVLTELELADNPGLTSMDWLDAQNYDTLRVLDVARTGLDADDLAWVGTSCTGLTELSVDGISLGDLSLCANLTGLTKLSAVNCEIGDLSGLAGCTGLTTAYLSCNKISELTGLEQLALTSRPTLDFTSNALESLSALPAGNYRALMLYDNAAGVAATIPDGVGCYQVTTPYFEGIEESVLATGNFGKVYVADCPQNQVVRLQGAFPSGRLELLSSDELLERYANDDFAYPLGTGGSHLSSGLSGDSPGFSVAPTIAYGG